MILKNVMFCIYPTYEDSGYISNQIVGAGQKATFTVPKVRYCITFTYHHTGTLCSPSVSTLSYCLIHF